MRTEFLCVSVLRVASGPRVKLASCKIALKPRGKTACMFINQIMVDKFTSFFNCS